MINKYLEEISNIKSEIESFPLEITEGTKKMKEKYSVQAKQERNSKVYNLINQVENNLEMVNKSLKEKLEKLMPKNKSEKIDIYHNKLTLLKKVIKYNNEYNDLPDKIGFNRVICDMDNLVNTDLKKVNNLLNYVINKFNTAGVKLTDKDFGYTVYTKKYMSYFFDNLGNDSFEQDMANKFDEIYWNCPNILIQLKLNIVYLVNKYSKNIETFCHLKQKNLFDQSETRLDNYESEYVNLKNIYEIEISKDPYININKFIDKQLNIDDYLKDSLIRKRNITKLINEDIFEKYTDENKNKFYLNIINLNKEIEEIENYHLFEPILKDLISRYKNKDKNKGFYNIKLKEFKKLEKEKDKCVIKYLKLEGKEKNYNKLNKLSSDINLKSDDLNLLYMELEEARINEKIYKYINDESTVKDGIKLVNSFYGYLKNLIIREYNLKSINEIEAMQERFYNFVYNENNVIISKFSLFSKYELELLVKNKYKLFDINLDIDELIQNSNNLRETLKFIERIYYLETNNISFENIKLICNINML